MESKESKIENYLKVTKDKQASLWLPDAVRVLGRGGNALDLGCGAGRDTKFLLGEGFHVVAVDKDERALEYLKELPRENLEVVQSRFEEFGFEEQKYDLINAQFSLPFTNRDAFDAVFAKVKKALKPAGIFVGQLFGVNDDWNKSLTTKTTFHTKEAAEALFGDMELLKFIERDYDGTIADGTPKHWHTFHILARKKESQ